MADRRFFTRKGPYRLEFLASEIGVEVAMNSDTSLEIFDVGPLDAAGLGNLSFLDNQKYLSAFASSAASACVVAPKYAEKAPEGMALLLSKEPYKAYARAAALFYPVPKPEPGVSSAAVVPTIFPIAMDAFSYLFLDRD